MWDLLLPMDGKNKGHMRYFFYLRQSLPAAGIIEESESARGERGRVGQGRVGFRVQARARWEKANYATCLFKKTVFDNENVLWLDLRSQMKP